MKTRLILAAALSVLSVQVNTPTSLAAKMPASQGESFAVVLGPNDSLDLQVGYLALARPDLVPVIQRVVAAQLQEQRPAVAGGGTRFVSKPSAEIEALAQQNLTSQVIEEIDRATGKAGAEPGGPGRAVHARPAVAGRIRFNGSMTLTGFICSGSGCSASSTLIHTARWDQGYATVKTTAKTFAPGGDSAAWANKSAAAKCYRGSSRCDVVGTQYLNVSGLNSVVTQSKQPGTTSARWELTFSANYLGSPYIGGPGASPYFKCDPYSSTAVCRWQ